MAVPALASSDVATLDRSFGDRLRAAGDRVALPNVVLPGREAPAKMNLERFEVWAPDAKIVAFGENGSEQLLPRPTTRYYRGTIEGEPDALVFAAVEADGTINAMATSGSKRFTISTGRRIPAKGGVIGARERDDDAPIFVRETDALDDMIEGATGWTCGTEKQTINSIRQAQAMADVDRATVEGSAGSVNASYSFRLAIETDYELYLGFGSNSTTLTNYIGSLVGATSTIYQRDVKATLTLGTVHIWTTSSDPWTQLPAGDPTPALLELGTYWHNNYAGVNRADVVMISGKNFSAGVAWTGTLNGGDFCYNQACTQYYGAYAFVGSISVITTTVPDPNATVNGKQYGMPFNNNFWILSAFAHEVGHNCSSPHTHCMALTAAEKTQYSTTRNFVDECYSLEGQGNATCFGNTVSNYIGACFNKPLNQGGGPTYYCPPPVEYGTLMSYCHNTSDAANPNQIPSRFLFGKAGEPSFKVLSYFSTKFEAVTPSVVITAPSAPLVCGAQNASVPSAAGVTYQWQITGGTINGSSTSNSVNFTPNAASTTLTVTATNATNTASITNSTTLTTSCGSCSGAPVISPQPANTTITSGQTAQLTVAATGGGPYTYAWYQATNGGNVPVGTNSATLSVSPAQTSNYFVWVSNACGATISNLATVTVNSACTPAGITAQPQNVTITSGQSTNLTVTPSGTGPFTYTWYRIVNGSSVATGTSQSLQASPTQTTSYFVWVYNSCGAVLSNLATVTVNPACTPATIASHPASTTIPAGQNVQLSVTGAGGGPYTYYWYQLLNGANVAVGTNSSTLSVSPTQTSQYFAWVYNACGAAVSNLATITVCSPPGISAQPGNPTITQGQNAQLSVTATGGGPYNYSWYQIVNGSSVAVGTNSSTLNVAPASTSSYFVWVYNSCGAVLSNLATVTVTPACSTPSITSHPANSTIAQGQNVILSVTATGGAPYTYQWYQIVNGANVATGTNSNTLSVSPAVTSQYFVWVYNPCGAQISNLATITVN